MKKNRLVPFSLPLFSQAQIFLFSISLIFIPKNITNSSSFSNAIHPQNIPLHPSQIFFLFILPSTLPSISLYEAQSILPVTSHPAAAPTPPHPSPFLFSFCFLFTGIFSSLSSPRFCQRLFQFPIYTLSVILHTVKNHSFSHFHPSPNAFPSRVSPHTSVSYTVSLETTRPFPS